MNFPETSISEGNSSTSPSSITTVSDTGNPKDRKSGVKNRSKIKTRSSKLKKKKISNEMDSEMNPNKKDKKVKTKSNKKKKKIKYKERSSRFKFINIFSSTFFMFSFSVSLAYVLKHLAKSCLYDVNEIEYSLDKNQTHKKEIDWSKETPENKIS